MTWRSEPPFRADHVGSLLRPPELLQARAEHAAGAIDALELRRIEDEAIREVVRMQEAVGLQSATDGELRRGSWHMDFIYQLGGVKKLDSDLVVEFRNRSGTISFTPASMRVDEPRAARPHDLRRGLHVPAGHRLERAAEADDPVAEHGALPRGAGRRSTKPSIPTWTSSGPISPRPIARR